jgi:hypothetical protein
MRDQGIAQTQPWWTARCAAIATHVAAMDGGCSCATARAYTPKVVLFQPYVPQLAG